MKFVFVFVLFCVLIKLNLCYSDIFLQSFQKFNKTVDQGEEKEDEDEDHDGSASGTGSGMQPYSEDYDYLSNIDNDGFGASGFNSGLDGFRGSFFIIYSNIK